METIQDSLLGHFLRNIRRPIVKAQQAGKETVALPVDQLITLLDLVEGKQAETTDLAYLKAAVAEILGRLRNIEDQSCAIELETESSPLAANGHD